MARGNKIDENKVFDNWVATGDKKHFQDLYQSMKPMLDSAASKAAFGSNLPKSAHEIWAAQNFLDSLRTYKPHMGVALQTHVYGAVHQKAKRLNYLYQNLGKMSEPRATQVGLYTTEMANLTNELGRAPSAAELSDRLGIGLKDVALLQKEVQKDLSLSGLEEEISIESSKDEEILSFIYYELTNDQRLVYDYIFGKHGKSRYVKPNKKIDFDRIAREVGFSVSKVRLLFNGIKKKFELASK